jgi:pimeloyl-ACP methyl ester carboxylesterase
MPMGGGTIQLANLLTSTTRSIRLVTYSRSLADGNHADPDSAFWGWTDICLHAPFREWSIEAEIENIRCPVLAVQGLDDEYGTLEQIHGIARRVADAKVFELADCGHSAHRDQADELIRMLTRFIGDSSKVTRFSVVAP